MNEHVSDGELRGFARHDLRPDRAIAVDDHLAACDDCRTRAATIGGAAGRIADLSTDLLALESHLSEEQVQQCASGTLTAVERARLDQHLAECRVCAREVDELKRWIAGRRVGRPRLYAAAAAAILLLLLSPLAVSRWFPQQPQQIEPAIAGFDLLTRDQQDLITTALAVGFAEPPAALAAMSSGSESLMGGKTSDSPFQPIAPLQTVTPSNRPLFRWNAFPGATEYTIAVFDADLRPIAGPASTAETAWTPSRALPRDRSYVWQVTARRGSESVTIPAPPAPLARFKVMEEPTATALERIFRDEPRAHLLLGILYTQAGARDEALTHLKQVPASDPHFDVARRTLEQWRDR